MLQVSNNGNCGGDNCRIGGSDGAASYAGNVSVDLEVLLLDRYKGTAGTRGSGGGGGVCSSTVERTTVGG